MTQEEIKKKAYEAYPEDCAWVKVDDENSTNYTEIDSDGQAWLKVDTNKPYREGYIKAIAEINKLPKVHGWVARDAYKDVENGVGLILHSSKPERGNEEWTADTIMAHLPWDMFPDLKWKDEPIEVEVLIRKI